MSKGKSYKRCKICFTDIMVSFLRPFLKYKILLCLHTFRRFQENEQNISKTNYRPFAKLTFRQVPSDCTFCNKILAYLNKFNSTAPEPSE